MIKVVPVLTRSKAKSLEILAFEHPLAGKQIVKGTLEQGEEIADGCARELIEESGIEAKAIREMGSITNSVGGETWHFMTMMAKGPIPDRFTFHTNDDGGHDFKFFWYSLADPLSDEWHEIFHHPIRHLQKILLTRRFTGRLRRP
ncbi:MAG: NUDIX domain-containing protein [Bacteroidetes bacterium]|jgi:8-oxo-dGTP pyrophosphatase MutT (NUDIX family)|nr:NUDIX domain-containing protein [Bacteroidota bacterium]